MKPASEVMAVPAGGGFDNRYLISESCAGTSTAGSAVSRVDGSGPTRAGG